MSRIAVLVLLRQRADNLASNEEGKSHGQPPYLDESLVINTRLKEVERRQEEDKKEEKQYKKRQLRFTRWTVIFTGLLFLTSAVSDVILVRQTSATRESANAALAASMAGIQQVRATEEANLLARQNSITSDRQNRNTLRETSRSNEINREALVSVQRAFVVFGQTMQGNPVAEETNSNTITSWEFRPVLQNTGTTPTRNLTHYVSYLWIQGALPNNFYFGDINRTATPTHFLLGPKEGATGATCLIPLPILRAVKIHQLHLYFWGWARYMDIFQETSQHVTLFAFEVSEIRGDPGTSSALFVWKLLPSHNCHDEECNGQNAPRQHAMP